MSESLRFQHHERRARTERRSKEKIYNIIRHLKKEKPNETTLTMSNVIMAYIMEEKPSDPAKEGSINRSGCASEKGPFFFPVVRDCGV